MSAWAHPTLGWFGLTAASSAAFLALARARAPLARRAGFGAGLLAIASVVLFGIVWPSLHTIVGLACLPCGLLFLGGVVRPSLADRRWVRVYGTLAVVLATASLANQAWWDVVGESSGHIAHASRPLLHRAGPAR